MATKLTAIDRVTGFDCAHRDELAATSADETTVKHVSGPNGRRLTLADLPSPDTKRWVVRRKAEIVAAVSGGLLSLEEACSRYALDPDEILSWQHRIDRFGPAGLRTTRTQLYLRRAARPESSTLPPGAGLWACVGG